MISCIDAMQFAMLEQPATRQTTRAVPDGASHDGCYVNSHETLARLVAEDESDSRLRGAQRSQRTTIDQQERDRKARHDYSF
jgi:hypothetical protein